LPAVAQGAIAVECRAGDRAVLNIVRGLDDEDTHRCVAAERAMNLSLHGSCDVPIAGYCVEIESGLALWGMVGDPHDGRLVRAQAQGALDDPLGLGERVASLLREQGADDILRRT
jgi:hydroxymethylbilane synthase